MKHLLPLLAFTLSVPALALPGCQTPGVPAEAAAEVAADSATVRSEIAALTASYQAAARAGDAAAITALHADDAVLQPAGKPAVRGRADVDSFLVAEHSEPVELRYTTVSVTASAAGDLAYEVGTAIWPAGPGKYLTVYRKTADGWKIVADTWSQDAPPAPAN